MAMFDDTKIEVHEFTYTGERLTANQLKELGEAGYELLMGWPLNERDYGPNQQCWVFRTEGLEPLEVLT